VIDELLAEYDRHLQEVAGVTPSTRQYRCRYAREFLQMRLRDGRLQWRSMGAGDLLRYVQLRASALRPASLRVLTGALRDFLRFLHLSGRGEERWVAAVPRPAPWPRSLLPQTLSKEQVRALLASFARTTRTGRRDYAMALCLTQLGLRVCEVAGLALEDIDGCRCTLRPRQTKQRRERLLPLPPRLAEAIARYLRCGRPSTGSRALFVRHRAPLGCALAADHVRGAMRRAFARSGIGVTKIHLLRHTLATALHQKGIGLKALADVLGHQCLETAARYARVNLRELRQAAQRWPEVRP
jgi:site-specific recombinase XerD